MFPITRESALCLVSQEVCLLMNRVFFSAFSSRWDQSFWWNWDSCWGFWPLDSSLAASSNHVANAIFSTAVPTVKQQGKAMSVESEKLSVSSLSTQRNFLGTKFEYNSDLFFFFINESPGVYVHWAASALNSVEFKWKYIIKKTKLHTLWHLIVPKFTSEL